MAKAPNVPWTREHFLIALNLYCKLPFGKLHRGNPLIIEVAQKMGRTPSSLAMKLCNFASLDPVQQARGIKGLVGATKQDREMWKEFQTQLSVLGPESEQMLHDLFTKDDDREVDFLQRDKVHLVAPSAAASAASTCRACSWRAISSRGANFRMTDLIRETGFACQRFTTQRLMPDSSRSTTG